MPGRTQSTLRLLKVLRRGHGKASRFQHFARATSTSTSPPHVLRSPFPDVSLPKGNAVEFVFRNCPFYFGHVALECSITGASYTYEKLVDAIARWGGFLQKLGVSEGDMVAIALPNCPEYAIAFYGTLCVGATAITINADNTASEVARQLEESHPKVVLGHPGLEVQLQEALRMYGKPLHLVLNGQGTSSSSANLKEVLEDRNIPLADPVQLAGNETAVLSYSSGKTGQPKGVSLSHGALAANIAMCKNPDTYSLRETTNDHQESLIGLLPFSHTSGLVPLLSLGLHSGVRVLTMDKPTPDHFVHTVRNHKVRHLHLSPPLLDLFISDKVDSSVLQHVEAVQWGAAPLDPSAVDAFRTKVGHPVFFQEGYGMTEFLVSHQTPLDGEKIGFLGKLLPNTQAKIVDLETGEPLPPNCMGEICIKSPSMMTGYHNHPDATSEVVDAEGWFHTGDVGLYDHDGYFKFVEKAKELTSEEEGLQN